jgi:hypothetical protein
VKSVSEEADLSYDDNDSNRLQLLVRFERYGLFLSWGFGMSFLIAFDIGVSERVLYGGKTELRSKDIPWIGVCMLLLLFGLPGPRTLLGHCCTMGQRPEPSPFEARDRWTGCVSVVITTMCEFWY